MRKGIAFTRSSRFYFPILVHEDTTIVRKSFRTPFVTKIRACSLHLTASRAKATGPNIKYMPEWKAFGWFNTEDQVEWDVQVGKKGRYDVYLDWSVSDAEAGKSFVFEAGDKKLKGKIGKTGSWVTYRKEKIGTIQLTAGLRKMIFKSNSKSEKGAMLDLRQLIIVPVK